MDYKAEFKTEGKVEERDGKKMVKISFPAYFQGHTFAVDLSRPGGIREQGGPYRVVFVLCSDFLLHLHRSDIINIDLEQGHSNLRLGPSMAKAESVELYYSNTKSGKKKVATLSFETDGTYIQRFVMQMPEDKLDIAVRFSGQMVNSILDVLSFQKQVPLQIRQIEVFHVPSGDLLRTYVTFPYTTNKDLDVDDLKLSQRIPKSLKPVLRLYREAINSSNPHYRFLCLYRMYEGLRKIQDRNSKKVVAKGSKPKRTRLRLQDSELTKRYFPSLVGKGFNAFLDHVREKYRIDIVHFNLDDYERMLLDPAEVKIVHKIDYTNAVLEQVMRQSLIQELKFMQEHKLK